MLESMRVSLTSAPQGTLAVAFVRSPKPNGFCVLNHMALKGINDVCSLGHVTLLGTNRNVLLSHMTPRSQWKPSQS